MGLKLGSLYVDIGANTSGLRKADKEINRTAGNMSKAFKRAGVAAAVAITIETARRLLLIADNMHVLERRLIRFTGSAEAAEKTMRALTRTATDTGVAIDGTVSTFEKFSLVRDSVGATNDQIIQMTDTLQKLGALGNSTGQAINNSLTQMSQAFALGRFEAQEFKSVLENTPEIIKAIAREMGLTMGEIRLRMLDGKLTSQDVFGAMLKAAEQTNEEFEEMPKSIKMVTQSLKNELTVAISDFDNWLGASAGVSGMMSELVEMIETFNEQNAILREQGSILEENRRIQQDVNALISTQEGKEADIAEARRVERTKLINELRELTTLRTQLSSSTDESDDTWEQLRATKERMDQIKALLSLGREESRAMQEMNGLLVRKTELQRILNDESFMGSKEGFQAELEYQNELIAALRERHEITQQIVDAHPTPAAPEEPVSAPAFQPSDSDLSTLEKIRLLGETEMQELQRLAEERREFIKTQVQLTGDEEIGLLENIAAEKLAKITEINNREEEIAKAQADRMTEIRATQQTAMLAGLRSMGTAANDIIRETGKESTGVAKAIFLAMKAIQVAEIIAATEVAAANAGAVASVGGIAGYLSSSQSIRTMGYASAALVGGLAVGKIGGGREFGGPTSGILAHPVNESGVPELLQQGSNQYLLPTGKNGVITPLSPAANDSSAQPTINIISNGTPQTITGTNVSRGEVSIMIDDATTGMERKINSSLATGRGDTARSLKTGFRTERNL